MTKAEELLQVSGMKNFLLTTLDALPIVGQPANIDKFIVEYTKATEELIKRYYSDTEIDELIKFHKSTVGQKSIKVAPMLLQDSMQIAESILAELPHIH